jgi:hypothetical protein
MGWMPACPPALRPVFSFFTGGGACGGLAEGDSEELERLPYREAGLDPASPDDVVWRFCQAHNYHLLTGPVGPT